MFLLSLAIGAWFQTAAQIDEAFREGLAPSPALLKVGSFTLSGTFGAKAPETWPAFCAQGKTAAAWVGRKLGAGESLSPSAGKRLAEQLNTALPVGCFSTVELDIEPLSDLPPWLVPFLKAVRNSLSPRFQLHVALFPPFRLRDTFWDEKSYGAVLEVTDGIDIMLYDTALKEGSAYRAAVHDVSATAGRLLEKFPKKEIWLGLPTYQDRTELHFASVENLQNVLLAWKAAPPAVLCAENFKIIYFAGYAMKETDRVASEELKAWRASRCRAK